MIGNLGPYAAMKDSGVPWLGEVPEHWEERSLGSLTSPISRRGRPDLPLLSVVREKGVIVRSMSSDDENHNFIPDDLSNYKVVRKGDLVINKMKAWQGSLGIAPIDGIVSPAYYVFDLAVGDRRYGQALLRSKPYVAFFGQASDGVRIGQWDLSIQKMKRIPVVLPPLAEQSAIVRFLDHAEGRIRRYIRAKQKLIELLEEQKQAIIHRAVTRGLDPNVRLKCSGVDWLGEIPEHWDVRRLKFLAQIKTGGRDTINRMDEGDYPFFVRSQTVERIDTYSFDGEAVLTAGDGAGVAKVFHYVNGKFDYHQRVYRFSNFRDVSGKFFFHYFSDTLRFEAFRETAKSTVDSIRLPMLQNFPVPLPPGDEQAAIVLIIERETQDINRSLSAISREISLLREYRTRLIADVVTGKLDVRAVAAKLPDQTDEPEAADDADALPEGDELAEDVPDATVREMEV